MMPDFRSLIQNDNLAAFKAVRHQFSLDVWDFISDFKFGPECQLFAYCYRKYGLPSGDKLVELILRLKEFSDPFSRDYQQMALKRVMFNESVLRDYQLQQLLMGLNFKPDELVMHYFYWHAEPFAVYAATSSEFDIALLHHSAGTNIPSFTQLVSEIKYSAADLVEASLIRMKIRNEIDLDIIERHVTPKFFSDEKTRELGIALLRAMLERGFSWEDEGEQVEYYSRVVAGMLSEDIPQIDQLISYRDLKHDSQAIIDSIWPFIIKYDNAAVCQKLLELVDSEALIRYVSNALSMSSCPRIHQLFLGDKPSCQLAASVAEGVMKSLPLAVSIRFINSGNGTKEMWQQQLDKIDRKMAKLDQLKKLLL